MLIGILQLLLHTNDDLSISLKKREASSLFFFDGQRNTERIEFVGKWDCGQELMSHNGNLMRRSKQRYTFKLQSDSFHREFTDQIPLPTWVFEFI